uniref:Uncharacterized protein n=1 Tax=Dendroctonus ponderosae TaxID=77166 RepID=A0AAR5QAC6_DENPD
MIVDFSDKNYFSSLLKDGLIRCIFFCEFHHTAGPIISCQVPENFVSKELFDSISVYIITKAELQRSTITVETRTVQYEHVVTKFSDYLMAMEIESRFLSTGKSNEKLTPILKTVLEDLNTKGECALLEGPIATHLKVCRIRSDPTPVLDHQVPVFMKALPPHQWDLTTQQVTPYIDGFNHVARIAALSDVDNNLVKACVQNLVYYGVVALVPLFQYGNIYCATWKLRSLAQDRELQVGQCVHRLIVPPITTYYGFRLNDSMRYPSVTICRRPGFNTDIFPNYGLRRGQSLLNQNVFRNFYFDNFTIKEFLEDTTYDFDDVVNSYAFNGMGMHLAAAEWTLFHTISYGKCFSFTPRETSSTYSISGGWIFSLKHDVIERFVDSYGVSQYGFHVYVHDPNEILTSGLEQDDSFLEYIYIEASEDIRLQLRYQEFLRVNTNENPCIDPGDQPTYSRSRCLEECYFHQIANSTNCTLPWLWLLPEETLPQCSNVDQVTLLASLLLSHNRETLMANCSCPKSCHVTIYTPSIISRTKLNENQDTRSFIAMHYANNLVTEMKELVGYNVTAFIADIGGSLGFLLGLSVVGFIRVIERIVCSIIKTYYQKKKKPDEEQRSETQSSSSSSTSSKSTKILHTNSFGKRKPLPDNINLYENLQDFESDDFKYYQKTLIAESSNSRY